MRRQTRESLKQLTPDWAKRLYWKATEYRRRATETYNLVFALRAFYSDRITVKDAEEQIRQALDTREERFLELMRREVYGRPAGPYCKLLAHAGCALGDLQASVRRYGLEGALGKLASEGVYLTSDEFKGKKDVVRGRLSFRTSPEDFHHEFSRAGFIIQSSGTRNRPVRTFVPLHYLAIRTFVYCVFLSAHDLFSYAHAMYDCILPASGGVNNLLMNSRIGLPTERWYARRVPGLNWYDDLYHYLTTYLVVLMGNWVGSGFPKPELIDIDEIDRIVDWVIANDRQGKSCCITAAASNATRIARAAWDRGVSLKGTKFICAGEPYTEAKREIIERSGATGISRYAYGGSTNVGYGCANPIHTDEIHVNQHMLALIAHPNAWGNNGPPIYPLLCSTLDSSSTRLLLNVESGDYASFEKRPCGCALEKAGLTVHLHRIRSFEKFTSEGMSYTFTDLFELLEKTLPKEFGGTSGDYQLVEDEDSNGQTRISIVVHPCLGVISEEKLIVRIRDTLGENRGFCRFWRDADTFSVKRAVPYASPRGKILPLHIAH
jgi:hypothetical protein